MTTDLSKYNTLRLIAVGQLPDLSDATLPAMVVCCMEKRDIGFEAACDFLLTEFQAYIKVDMEFRRARNNLKRFVPGG